MKLKYYIVEYISYASKDGYPDLGTDINTMERIRFLSKKKAKRFIKRFIKSDPEYVKMWIAHITLHTVSEKIKMIKYPTGWEKTAISKKGREESMLIEDAPIYENALPSKEPPIVGDEYPVCLCKADETHAIILYEEDCPVHGWSEKSNDQYIELEEKEIATQTEQDNGGEVQSD
jgi:hypothetical protein